MRYTRELAAWLCAFVVSFMTANLLITFYFYDPGWIARDKGATKGIYEPHSRIVRADEGFTITVVDENGYINQNADLTDLGYVLVMGNSQSNGNNVMPSQKWVSLLNNKIQNVREETKTQVYNVSAGGYGFCDQMRGVEAAITEFPDSMALVIQITSTNMSIEDLSMMEQRAFAEEARGAYLVEHLNNKQLIRNGIKDFLPLLVYISELKLSKINLKLEGAFFQGNGESVEVPENSWEGVEWIYTTAFNECMRRLRTLYSGEIVILNIPGVSLQADGELAVSTGQYEAEFIEACEKNDILFLQMGDIYMEEYCHRNILPYGFSNTKPGTGHLNKEGHQMVADALFSLLLEREVVK